MNNRRIDDHVQDYYAQQQLRPEKLAQLISQAGDASSQPVVAPSLVTRAWRSLSPKTLAFAALLALCVLVPVAVWQNTESGDWSLRAAREIALNHKKQLASEFSAEDYTSLRAKMAKLDFVLTAPTRLHDAGLRVVGARYCSIQGHLAAQIKLEDAHGKRYTLYQRSLTDMPAATTGGAYMVDGINIQAWREAGLFFGLASAPE